MKVFDAGGGDVPAPVRDRVLTLPNVLSLLRVLALPVIVIDLVDGRYLRAFVLLAVFVSTDWLDGYVARRFDQVTRLGTLLDPISDRLLFVAVGIAMVLADLVPLWAIALLLVRDLLVLAAGMFLLVRRRRPPPVSRLGKAATFGLMWALPSFILAAVLGAGPDDPQPLIQAFAWFALIVNLALYYAAAWQYAHVVALEARSA